MQFAERPGKSAVERFMQLYFLHAKSVGDLTGTFLAHLDEQMAKRGRRFLPTLRRRPGKLNGFVLDRGRLALPVDAFFQPGPVGLLGIFALHDRYGLEFLPPAMSPDRPDAKRSHARVRHSARPTALFPQL